MEFDFDLNFLQSNAYGISIWHATSIRKLSANADDLAKLTLVVDAMGRASCKAQQLPKPVTAIHFLRAQSHRLYLVCDEQQRKILAMLKVGTKKLFIHNMHLQYEEIAPLCVLDFYVHEMYQRKGIGRCLFDFMLTSESVEPRLVAYDAPSNKFLNFLRKHYGLRTFTPQNCCFVVFHDYFAPTKSYTFEQGTDVRVPSCLQPKHDAEQQKDAQLMSESPQKSDDERKTKQESKPNRIRVPVLPHLNKAYRSEIDWIEKQIEQTKQEISQSESKIYQQHLTNSTSPYSIAYHHASKVNLKSK
mmetsp:Transcript_8218/g.12735  ORF Transcript_8218/g.12735 Transcript_8218/m.12735 type:complete len:302 (-) Transcript_8218:179-1084(-)